MPEPPRASPITPIPDAPQLSLPRSRAVRRTITPHPRINHEQHHLSQFIIDQIPGASVIKYWRGRCRLSPAARIPPHRSNALWNAARSRGGWFFVAANREFCLSDGREFLRPSHQQESTRRRQGRILVKVHPGARSDHPSECRNPQPDRTRPDKQPKQ